MLPSKSASKSIKKLEQPRPLKWMSEAVSTQSLYPTASEVGDEVLQELDGVVKHLSNSNCDNTLLSSVLKVCQDLKTYGPILEMKNTGQLDRCFVALRNAAGNERLDPLCRLRLLEVIELRSMGWKIDETFENNYKNKLLEAESLGGGTVVASGMIAPLSPLAPNASFAFPYSTGTGGLQSSKSPNMGLPGSNNNNMVGAFGQILSPVPQVVPVVSSVLGPGEVLKSSGKYAKPTRIPAKNYYKDEVVIRNSDSGKVMGIKGRRVHMIEELSGTVVSFQRVVQGAKDRLVQVTGSTEECIGTRSLAEHAERLQRIANDVIQECLLLTIFISQYRDRTYPIQNSESSTCLLSSIYRSDDGRQQTNNLMHSYSMNDASIDEYQYTVAVGRDTLKLSGYRLDLVKVAKLVLEEYFAGDAKRTLHESVEDEAEFEPCYERRLHFSNDVPPEMAAGHRPGHRLKRSSSVGNPFLSCGEDSTSDSGDSDDETFVEAKDERRDSVGVPAKASPNRIVYDRDVLLFCATSPHSKRPPDSFSTISQDIAVIIRKSPEFFDPVSYQKLNSNRGTVESSAMMFWPGRSESWDDDPSVP